MAFMIDENRPFGDHITDTFNFGYLYEAGVLMEGKSYYCPSTPKHTGLGQLSASYRYEDYIDKSGRWPWNSDPSGWNTYYVRTSYNYVPQSRIKKIKVYNRRYFPDTTENHAELDTRLIMATDLLSRLDILPHKTGKGAGVNALFADASVAFRNNREAFDTTWWGEYPWDVGHNEFHFRTVLELLAK
jgi:hypothetical protein